MPLSTLPDLTTESFVTSPKTVPLSVAKIFRLWLPLAISFELMMLEGPAVQGAVGRLPDAKLHLASWSLTMALSLLIESPVIMLLSTAIALVKDESSYRALRRFMLNMSLWCTVLTGLVAFTPLFDLIAGKIMGQPQNIIEAARPAMRIMLFWTAAIAWRRFYQGILVRYGHTRMVSWGTAIRLCSAIFAVLLLVSLKQFSGSEVCAIAIMTAVITEAIATTFFALPIVRREVLSTHVEEAGLTQRSIWQFHAPLAATTLLILLAQPITSAALARLPHAVDTLAAWPVAYMVLLVIRGWGLALQEISVAQALKPEAREALKRFTWIVGWISLSVTIILALTPLLEIYLTRVLKLPPELHGSVRLGVGIAVILPLITALGSWVRGVLVTHKRTQTVYRGMGINLTLHAALLALGVWLQLPGMWVAAVAFTLASVGEYIYLVRSLPPVANNE